MGTMMVVKTILGTQFVCVSVTKKIKREAYYLSLDGFLVL
jgi:hypothetical protein